MKMLVLKKLLIIFNMMLVILSKIISQESCLIGKKYTDDPGHFYTFTKECIIEDYWTDVKGWTSTRYSYKFSTENTYLVLFMNKDNKKEKYYVFLFDDKHIILCDANSQYEMQLSLYNRAIDESYILPVYNCKASSYYSEVINKEIVNYLPENLGKRINMNWVEGVKDDGIDEFISCTVPGENGVREIFLVNGFFSPKKTSLFYDNNRVKKLYITTYDSEMNMIESFPCELKDMGQPQKIKFSKVAKNITLSIKEIYRGRKYQDTAICSIYVDGLSLY